MRLTNAIICQDASVSADHRLVITNPFPGAVVPAAQRDRLAPGEPLMVRLDALKMALALAGGSGRVRIDAVLATPVPGLETTPGGHAEFDWPIGAQKWYVTVDLKDQLFVPFIGKGVYRIALLGNGVPLGDIPLPIFWSDEV